MTFMHTSSTPPCRPGHCVGNRNSIWSKFKTVKPESPNPPDYVLQVRKYALHCTNPAVLTVKDTAQTAHPPPAQDLQINPE